MSILNAVVSNSWRVGESVLRPSYRWISRIGPPRPRVSWESEAPGSSPSPTPTDSSEEPYDRIPSDWWGLDELLRNDLERDRTTWDRPYWVAAPGGPWGAC